MEARKRYVVSQQAEKEGICMIVHTLLSSKAATTSTWALSNNTGEQLLAYHRAVILRQSHR